MPSYMLGKQAPKIDKRTFMLSEYMAPVLKKPLVPRDWGKAVPYWPMFMNDTISDCTVAAVAHQIVGWTAVFSKPAVIADADVEKAYSAISGYVSGRPLTDNGAYMLDALNYARKFGIGGHKIGAYMKIDRPLPLGGPLTELLWVIDTFGSAYVGLALPASAQNQVRPNGSWTVPFFGPRGNGAPGSWGGHVVIAVGYNKNGLICPTWNLEMDPTWNFIHYYCDELYAVLSPDWLSKNISPSGFNMAQLQQDLQKVA